MKIFFKSIAVLLLMALFATQLPAVKNFVKERIVEHIAKSAGLKVKIEDIELYPHFRVDLKNVVVLEDSRILIKSDCAKLLLNPLSLISGRLRIFSLSVNEAEIVARPREASSSFNADISVDRLRIDNLSFGKRSFSIGGRLSISSVENDVSVKLDVRSNTENNVFYEVAVDKKAGRSGFHLYGKDLTVIFTFIPDADGGVDISDLKISYGELNLAGEMKIKEGFIKESRIELLPFDLSRGTPLNGEIVGSGNISGKMESPTIKFTLKSQEIGYGGFHFRDSTLEIDNDRLLLSFINSHQICRFIGDLLYDDADSLLPSEMRVKTDLVTLAPFFPDEFDLMAGSVQASVRKEGAVITLENGEVIYNAYGVHLIDAKAALRTDFKGVDLTSFSASDKIGGQLVAKGGVTSNGSFLWDLKFGKPLFFRRDNLSAAVGGYLRLVGDKNGATLSGKLKAEKGEIALENTRETAFRNVEVTHINGKKERRGLSGNYPLHLDMDFVAKRVFVYGGGLSSRWKGKTKIAGLSNSARFSGEFKLTEGEYLLRGKTFKLMSGSYVLAGDSPKKANLNIKAVINIAKKTITASVSGPPQKLRITLSSAPAMSKQEILSWLLFNKGLSGITSAQSAELKKTAIILDNKERGKKDLLAKITDLLKLDKIDISSSDERNVSLRVGKFLSEGTMISISRRLSKDTRASPGSHCLEIESDIGKRFLLRAEVGDDSTGQINLIWKKDY